MLAIAKRGVHSLGQSYIRAILRSEIDMNKPDPRGPNECTHEYAFALNSLRLAPQYQDVLDVGSGRNPLRHSSRPAVIR